MPSIRRFYDRVTVAVSEEGGDGLYAIYLDDRPVRTPARGNLVVPSQALADSIAEEWQAQQKTIVPATMPLTQLSCTALDRVVANPGMIAAQLRRYCETDLLCYRTDKPAALAARQAEAWQPVLDWLAETRGIDLAVTAGIIPIAQPREALDKLEEICGAIDPMALSAVITVANASASTVLALALFHGRLDGDAVWRLSQIDESFQVEQWGDDDEARIGRMAVRSAIVDAERFLRLLVGGKDSSGVA